MIKLTPIIVVYKQKIDECLTFNTLASVLETDKFKKIIDHVVIVDNSDEKRIYEYNKSFSNKCEDIPITYIGEMKNIGIAKAYNNAIEFLSQKKDEREDWVLLLDQDSSLKEDLFDQFISYASHNHNDEVGIVAPRVISKNKLVSPLMVGDTPHHFHEPTNLITGLQQERMTGINSCTFLKVAAIQAINGFDEKYPIDYLDHITFYKIFNSGYKLFVIDAEISHDLSFYSFKTVPLSRYLIYLEARLNFIREVSHLDKLATRDYVKDFVFLHSKRTISNRMYKHFFKGNKVFLKAMSK